MIGSKLMGGIMPMQNAPLASQQGIGALLQSKLTGMLENPIAMIGAGILGSQGNALQGGLLGLQAAQQTKDVRLGRERQENEDKYRGERRERQSLLDSREDEQYQQEQEFKKGYTAAFETGGPESALSYLAKNRPDMASRMLGQGGSPAAIEEFKFLQNLGPEGRKLWMQNKRGPKTLDMGGYHALLNPVTQTPESLGNKTLPPAQTPEVKAAQSQATALGRHAGEQIAQRPSKNATLDKADALLDSLDNAEGFDEAFGKFDAWVPEVAKRQRRIDVEADIAQLISTLTVDERGKLAGQGQITEGEQAMLKASITTLQNPAISDTKAKAELGNLKRLVQASRDRANGVDAPDLSLNDVKESSEIPTKDVVLTPEAEQALRQYGY